MFSEYPNGTWVAKKTWLGLKDKIQLPAPGPYKCELWAEADGMGDELKLVASWPQEAVGNDEFFITAFTTIYQGLPPAEHHWYAQFKVLNKNDKPVYETEIVKVDITE